MAAQLDAADSRLDADDLDYGAHLRAAKMEQLRHQLQLKHDRLAASDNVDATLRNRLTARLKAAENKSDDDEVHINEGVRAEADLDALLKRIEAETQALAASNYDDDDDDDTGDAGGQREAAKARLAQVHEKCGVAKLDHQKYLKRARPEAVRHHLAHDRALLDRSSNLNSVLKNRLADKLKSAEDMLRSATNIGRLESAKRSDKLSQQLGDRTVDAEEANAAVSTAFASTLKAMIAATKKEMDESIDTSSADASKAVQKKARLAELRTQLSSDRQRLNRTKNADTARKERLAQQIKEAETEQAHAGAGRLTKQLNDLQALLDRRETDGDLQ